MYELWIICHCYIMVSLQFNYELSMEMDGTVLKQTAADDTTSFLQTHGQFHRI